jgi:hypothetical protein
MATRSPALHLAMLRFFVLGAVGKWAWMQGSEKEGFSVSVFF